MSFLNPLFAAFTMYSKFPAPKTEWTSDTMAWALCFFPLVGVCIGAVLRLWLTLCRIAQFGAALSALGALAIPLILSGFIHMDGFCDTADALSSNLSRERKLEILKDVHTGAFAVILSGLYLVAFFAAWFDLYRPNGGLATVLCAGLVLSRALSGLAAVTLPNARGSGLLASFTQPMNLRAARIVMLLWIAVAAGVMLYANLICGVVSIVAAGVVFVYYLIMSRRQFGGITGDLAGFFLQLCELAMVLALAAVRNILAV